MFVQYELTLETELGDRDELEGDELTLLTDEKLDGLESLESLDEETELTLEIELGDELEKLDGEELDGLDRLWLELD